MPIYYASYVRTGPGTQEGPATSQEGIGSDFVVIVLDVPEDFNTWYLGSITYSTDWNNLDVWTHIGYPVIFSSVTDGLPYLEAPFPVINAYHPGFFHTEHGYAIRKPLGSVFQVNSMLTMMLLGRKCSVYQLRRFGGAYLRYLHEWSLCWCLRYRRHEREWLSGSS